MNCAKCGRPIELIDGTALHVLPRPADPQLSTPVAQREWGHELGLWTLATGTHQAVAA